MGKLILIGGGGHCRSVIDSIDKSLFDDIGIVDNSIPIGEVVNGVPVIGRDNDLCKLHKQGFQYVFVSVGSIGNTKLREKLVDYSKKIGFQFINVIDSTAILSKHVKLGQGIFIGKGVIINCNSIIGSYSIINTGAIVEHECNIGQYVHIAPGSVLAGGVKIGNHTHIGMNSSLLQNINIGENCMVGARSVVLSDLSSNQKIWGVVDERT